MHARFVEEVSNEEDGYSFGFVGTDVFRSLSSAV